MSLLFEQIDTQDTPMGELTLRRRRIPAFGDTDIYEVKLGDDYLMSSMFVDAEVALADLGLQELQGHNLSVVVGGLGLGYTAAAVLRDERVGELLVVDALEQVIGWHRESKVPLGAKLTADPRTRYIHADFFKVALQGGFDPDSPGRFFDAVFLDIDHSPKTRLRGNEGDFYSSGNLAQMAQQIKPGGVFTVWSNEPEDEAFMHDLRQVFESVRAEVVSFYNPFQDRDATNTVYVARKPMMD